jgi:hypothetical protein
MELNVPVEDALAISVAAMKAAGIGHISIDSTGRSLVGRTRLTVRSLGTRCHIDVSHRAGGSRLVCRCCPRAELILTDWGAGRKALDALVADVDRQCARDWESNAGKAGREGQGLCASGPTTTGLYRRPASNSGWPASMGSFQSSPDYRQSRSVGVRVCLHCGAALSGSLLRTMDLAPDHRGGGNRRDA